MSESAHDGRQAEDAVDVEHHRREHCVTCQRRIRRALQQHHQDHHLHRHRRQSQDQRAVRFTEAHRQHLGMVRNAEGDADDHGEDDSQQPPQHDATMRDCAMLQGKTQPEHDERDGDGQFGFEKFHGYSFSRSRWRSIPP